MANKAISELPQAQNVNNQDLFVLEQSGIAKKLTAETFITEQGIIDALAEALDGHGGIQSVTLQSLSGRVRTYLITFSDGSATTFQVLDGTSIDRIVKTSTAGLTDTYTVFMNDGTTTFFTVTNGADGTVSEAMLNDALKDKAPAITETTESSAIANFTDGADDLVMHHVIAEINPVQDLSNGDPSPDNICPISGHTEVNVTRVGKNLFDDSIKSVANGGFVFFNSTSSRRATTATLPAGTYTFSVTYSTAFSSTKAHLNIYDTATDQRLAVKYNATQCTFTLSATTNICAYAQNANLTANDVLTGQIEVGSTATTYEPYITPATASLSWQTEAGTVYGGTIDVATGLLTVNAMLEVFDELPSGNDGIQSQIDYCLPTTSIGTVGDYTRISFGIRGDIQRSDYNLVSSSYSFKMCNMLKHYFSYADESSHWYRNTTLYAYFTSSLVGTTITSVINYLKSIKDTNPLSFWVPLAHPQTYQLTGQQLATFLGTNNVWADTGNVSVTYPADTKMFIEKLTMPTEDDLIANQAITSGKFFMVGNNLYIATAAIASGAKIIEGTNATRLSLADALNRL